jgi:hypothetical protein
MNDIDIDTHNPIFEALQETDTMNQSHLADSCSHTSAA